MACCYCWSFYLFAAFVVYKVLDRLIRIPQLLSRLSRHVLITGCDTGFGHELAKRLDRFGLVVFAACLTEKGEEILKKQCSSRLKTLHMNVADPQSVRKAFDFVKGNLPPGKGLWGLVNNAGIAGKFGPLPWMQLEDYKEVFDINLYGLIDVTTVFLPLIKQAKGRISNTASVFGRQSLGGGPYTISKYGVEAFSDGLRRELYEYGCSVHIIEPGFHKTNITSSTTLGGGFSATWERLSPELKEEYGQEFYEQAKDIITNKFVDKIASDRISDVVDAYEHAMMGMFPRARYVVGKDAKFFWLPVQWLPEWIGDFILRNLQKDRPKPAVLKKR